MLGIDLGLKDFLITSDGDKIANPRFLKTSLPRLARLQKRHSKARKDSNNKEKRRLKMAKLHARVANQRKDFLHKASRRVVNLKNINCLAVETLKVKNMLKNPRLSRAISDIGWSTFITYLSYKLIEQGKVLVKINSFFPSSKTCNNCGAINKDLQLSDRIWTCKNCKKVLDRDINASLNIKKEGYKILKTENTVGTTEIQACGAVVRPSITRRVAKKQEASTIVLT